MNEHDILIWVSIICIASELLILCIFIKKIDRELSIVRERLKDMYDFYSMIDNQYNIILARTNELGNLLSDLTKECTKCNDIIRSKLAELEKLTTKINNNVTNIDDCMNSVNEAVVPVIQSGHDILDELKEKLLTETEKETNNDN